MKYLPAIDGLRAVAVLSVLAFHAQLLGLGYLGVDVFFVISGYLITSILRDEQRNGGIRLGAFYLRRVRRLYPALCALVACLLLAGWISWRGALIGLTYLGNYIGLPGDLAHLWSLAVEEQYYLLWPLLLPLVMRTRRPDVTLLGLYLLATLWATCSSPYHLRLDTRMSGLLLGGMLAFVPTRSRWPFVLLALSSIGVMLGLHHRPFAEAATACLILLSRQTTIPFLTRPAFVYTGRISYGLYLYHWPMWFVAKDLVGDGALRAPVMVALAFACAIASYHTLEAWFRRSRVERVMSPRTAPVAPSPEIAK